MGYPEFLGLVDPLARYSPAGPDNLAFDDVLQGGGGQGGRLPFYELGFFRLPALFQGGNSPFQGGLSAMSLTYFSSLADFMDSTSLIELISASALKIPYL